MCVCVWCACVGECVRMVCVCVCMWREYVCVPRHKSYTNLNMVTGSTVLATGPMALHARTNVNVSSGQQLMLSLPSPFARPSTDNMHISQVCSYVVHKEQSVWCVCMCARVCVCVCVYVCVHVQIKVPFLLLEYVPLFLFFSF